MRRTSGRTSGRFGCALYEMLTGRRLFDGIDHGRPGRRPSAAYAELPGEAAKLEPLLEAWLARDPAPNADSSGEEGEELEALDPAGWEQLRTLGYVQ